ncbi:MAG: hypothetical protein JW939_09295 [Candidatus Thermoplasmatota archaeon]|nr:hypothetical protein [Candidatus Thermoplasmatota archaeon]
MKEITISGRISSIATVEGEDKTEIKTKIEGTWEMDGAEISVSLVLKGSLYSMQQLFNDSDMCPGKEVKIGLRDGLQTFLTSFEELQECDEGGCP